MPAITGDEVVNDMFALLNCYLPGESVPNNDAQYARRLLNDMLSGWSQQVQLSPFISRERFNLVADQGGPDDPYTIGDGGDFDTTKPANQNRIVSANLILTSTDPEVRVPLGIYTDDAYDANAIPDLSSGQPTGIYYSPTYAGDLGSIMLWPVPDTAENDLELFLQQAIAQFANLTTTYYVPDGYPEALKYNLAVRGQVPFGKRLDPDAKKVAVNSLSVIMRANLNLSDLMNDAYVFTDGRRSLYNIQSGQ